MELLALMGNVKCHGAIKQIINIIECVECDVASVSSRKRIAEIASRKTYITLAERRMKARKDVAYECWIIRA